jgi:hypothetical protein
MQELTIKIILREQITRRVAFESEKKIKNKQKLINFLEQTEIFLFVFSFTSRRISSKVRNFLSSIVSSDSSIALLPHQLKNFLGIFQTDL